MAKTNCCNPTTMNLADWRHDCHGKGTGKERAPPARRSARTNPSAAVGDFINPRLLKPPPKSIPPAPGAPAIPWILRCAQTNPSALVGNFIDPHLLKPPPESILPAPGAPGMPSLVRVGDVPLARAASPYPLRNNRTPAPNPPAIIYGKVCTPGDVSLLNFRSPSLPAIHHPLNNKKCFTKNKILRCAR